MNTHDPHALIYGALQSLDISIEYPAACADETAYWLKNDGLDDPELLDMTHLPFVTMDNEDSRDLDQAFYIEDTDAGYRVMYALADAAWYIKPGSALFDEALKRGTSYYTPLLAAAMLPAALSEGLISLNPDVHRRSLVFDMSLDTDAAVTNCIITRARIKSQAKLSYAGVQDWLDSPSALTRPFDNSLHLLKEVGNKLILAAESRGVIRFDRTSTQIQISGSPPQLRPVRRERFDTERYNEQLSLLCNMQGAELLLGLAGVSDVVQAIFRVHEAPLRKNLNKLRQVLDAIADANRADERWRWLEGQSLTEYVDALPAEPQNQRRVRAVQRQIMQAQRGSRFTPEPGEHHALKVCGYARFSSPMREIVGIFTHKELLEALCGHGLAANEENNLADEALREKIIEAANSARQKQRQLDKKIELAALHQLFISDLESADAPDTPVGPDVAGSPDALDPPGALDGPDANNAPWHIGTIVGMRSDKLYISLDDVALDIKVYKDDLDADLDTEYTFSDASAHPLPKTKPTTNNARVPVWLLGQAVKIRILSFDVSRQRLVFRMQPLESIH